MCLRHLSALCAGSNGTLMIIILIIIIMIIVILPRIMIIKEC